MFQTAFSSRDRVSGVGDWGPSPIIFMILNASFSYPEPFLRAVRRGALAKSISELASDWIVLAQDIVFLPCFHGIRLWIWPEPLVAPRVRRALGTRMSVNRPIVYGTRSEPKLVAWGREWILKSRQIQPNSF
jgi:hypothetical protein